jgi:hypothetical protein
MRSDLIWGLGQTTTQIIELEFCKIKEKIDNNIFIILDENKFNFENPFKVEIDNNLENCNMSDTSKISNNFLSLFPKSSSKNSQPNAASRASSITSSRASSRASSRVSEFSISSDEREDIYSLSKVVDLIKSDLTNQRTLKQSDLKSLNNYWSKVNKHIVNKNYDNQKYEGIGLGQTSFDKIQNFFKDSKTTNLLKQTAGAKKYKKPPTKTNQKVKTPKGDRIVYKGPRGGKYVKLNNKLVNIKNL